MTHSCHTPRSSDLYTTLNRKDADAANRQSARAIVDWQAWDSLLLEYTFLYDNDDRKQFPVVDAGAEDELTNSGPEDQFAKTRSEEHTSELQSLMRRSYAVFCLTKKNIEMYQTTKSKGML